MLIVMLSACEGRHNVPGGLNIPRAFLMFGTYIPVTMFFHLPLRTRVFSETLSSYSTCLDVRESTQLVMMDKTARSESL